jgi:lipoprotein-anchoring transpeptidase ErfK/SrfK
VLFSRDYQTADSVAHKVEAGETIEKIATDYNLPRDCAGSIARINKVSPLNVRVGDSLKVIRPLKMDIRVSKKHLRLTAYLNGGFFGEFPVGIGMDDATPAGEFVIKAQGKDKNPNWTKTLEDGSKRTYKFGDPENILGTRWMGLEEKEGAVGLGIHGTTKDETVPGRKSAGCIRMHNADVELLYDFTPDGTKVTIAD